MLLIASLSSSELVHSGVMSLSDWNHRAWRPDLDCGWQSHDSRVHELLPADYPRIVLASGDIVSASRESHPHLFWALRGIVTKFEFVAFEQGLIWGGVKQYAEDSSTEAISLLDKCCHDQALDSDKADIHAEILLITVYIAPIRQFITMAVFAHGKPADDPAVFDQFSKLPAIASTTKVRSIADVCVKIKANNPHGSAQVLCSRSQSVSLMWSKPPGKEPWH